MEESAIVQWLIVIGIVGAPVLFLMGRAAIKRWIETGVDHRFERKIEDHKARLQMTADAARYDLERQLTRQNLYSSRGHDAAVEVHRACRVAHGDCLNLRGFRRDLTFEEFDDEDLSGYMDRWDIPQGKQTEILATCGRDRARGIKMLKDYRSVLELQRAQRSLGEARNTAYANELYFDDEVIRALDRLFSGLLAILHTIEFNPGADGVAKEYKTLRPEADAALEGVHTVLRERLRGGEGPTLSRGPDRLALEPGSRSELDGG